MPATMRWAALAVTLALLPALAAQPAAAQPAAADHELECSDLGNGRSRCTKARHDQFRWGAAAAVIAGGGALLWGIYAWQKRGQKPQPFAPLLTHRDFGIAFTTRRSAMQLRINPNRNEAQLRYELRW